MSSDPNSIKKQPGLDQQTYVDERKSLVDGENAVAERFDKAILTLSAGALYFAMTFVKDIAKMPRCCWSLFLAWLAFGVAIVVMLGSLLTSQSAYRRARDTLDRDRSSDSCSKATPCNCFACVTHWLNVASIVAFLIGIVFLAYFIWANMPRG